MRRPIIAMAAAAALGLACCGCEIKPPQPSNPATPPTAAGSPSGGGGGSLLPEIADEVTVYVALDREFSQPILKDYERATNIYVNAKFDVESTKTVGLRMAIEAEAERPICDLFWNNEILNTLLLKKQGLLRPFNPPNAGPYPPTYKARDGTWYGFAGRARILLVNTDMVALADMPSSILDLTNPRWKGKIAMAKPLSGTTATHAVCLFEVLGEEEAKQFFQDLKANGVQVLSGNKQVAQAVARGDAAIGWTDTDDAMVEIDFGSPVAIIYPDRESSQMGTLFIPNTLAVIKDSPHPLAAEELANDLLSPEVEARLAKGASAQIPLNPLVETPARVETPRTVHAMDVDFEAAVRRWDDVAAYLTAEFGSAP